MSRDRSDNRRSKCLGVVLCSYVFDDNKCYIQVYYHRTERESIQNTTCFQEVFKYMEVTSHDTMRLDIEERIPDFGNETFDLGQYKKLSPHTFTDEDCLNWMSKLENLEHLAGNSDKTKLWNALQYEFSRFTGI